MDRNELIFDRTQAEIDMIQILIQQNLPLPYDNLRIAWDWRALNRIETFCAQLVALLNSHGYNITITTKTNWTKSSENSEAEGRRILNNIDTIRKAFIPTVTSPTLPASPSLLTFAQANNIEKILYDIDIIIFYMTEVILLTGTFSTGTDYAYQYIGRWIKTG